MIVQCFKKIKNAASATMNAVTNAVSSTADAVMNAAATTMNAVKNAVATSADSVKNVLAPVALTLGTLMAAAPLVAAEPAEKPTLVAQVEDGQFGSDLSSVIVDLERGKQDFEKFVVETLSPQQDRIGKSFEENVGRAEELLNKLEKDPANKEFRAEYDLTLSGALTEATGYLREFSQLEKPTGDAIDGMARSIDDAHKAFQSEAVNRQKQADASKRRGEEIRQRLKAVAEQYHQQIEQGKGLPREIEHDIRLLDADRKDALVMAKVDEMAAVQAQQTINDLQAQRDEVQQLKTDIALTFHQASSQKVLLQKVAGVRAGHLHREKIYKQLSDVSKAVSEQKKIGGQMNSRLGALVDQILKREIAQKGAQVAKHQTSSDQTASDILKSYLPSPKSK